MEGPVAFSWFFRGLHLLGKTVFGSFSWRFRGPRFGQILRVLALEKSSESRNAIAGTAHRIAKVIFCDAHCTAEIASFGPI